MRIWLLIPDIWFDQFLPCISTDLSIQLAIMELQLKMGTWFYCKFCNSFHLNCQHITQYRMLPVLCCIIGICLWSKNFNDKWIGAGFLILQHFIFTALQQRYYISYTNRSTCVLRGWSYGICTMVRFSRILTHS